MKKWKAWLAVGTLVLSMGLIAGCGNKTGNDDKPIDVKVAVIGNSNHQSTIMAKMFKEKLDKKAPGKFKIQIYENGSLGDERAAVEGVKMGTIQMTVVTMDGAVPAWVPDTQIMSLPYLFQDKQEAYKALDGVIYNHLVPQFEKQGFKYLGAGELGFRHFTNNKKPIHSANDMAGLSIRVQEAPVWFALMKSLDASATPVSFSELYTALQQGMVDGEENPIASIYTSKFYEVQKYLALDGHTYAAVSMIMNKKLYDNLTPELKKAVDEAAKEAIPEQRKAIDAIENDYLAKLKDNGMQITIPDKTSFIEKTKPVFDDPEVKKLVTPSFVQEVRESLK